MAKEMFLSFVKKGFDPKISRLLRGGAGPVHAAAITDKLRINQVYVPKHAAVFAHLASCWQITNIY